MTPQPSSPGYPSTAPVAGQSPLELSTEGILVLDAGGRITLANSRAGELLRYASRDLKGIEFWDALPEDIAAQHRRPALRGLETTDHFTFLVHERFESRWIEYRLTRSPGGGTVVHLTDVSERHKLMELLRASEKRNREIFDANPNVMWIYDLHSFQIVSANQAALDFYGWNLDEMLQMQVSALYPEEDRIDLHSTLPGLAGEDGGEDQETRICRHRKRDGEVVLVELSGRSIPWRTSRGAVVSVADVTRRQLADDSLRTQIESLESELLQRSRELESAWREQDAVIYALSHDLQSPLHIVDGFAKTLAAKYSHVLDEQGMHYLSRLQATAQQMAKLTGDLRLMLRIPRAAVNPQDVDLSALGLRIAQELRQREPRRAVELEVQAGLRVQADRNLVSAMLLCLLENAFKFTARVDQPWIRIGAAPASDESNLVLCIADNGAGFDPAYAGKLFIAFQRLHSSADFRGAGLGLAIVRQVAARLGGKVWAESILGSGASFYVSLPRAAAPADSVPSQPWAALPTLRD